MTSVSISGIDILSIFKKRSNKRLYLTGSNSVIFKQNDTNDPAADPRPGPTMMWLDLA